MLSKNEVLGELTKKRARPKRGVHWNAHCLMMDFFNRSMTEPDWPQKMMPMLKLIVAIRESHGWI